MNYSEFITHLNEHKKTDIIFDFDETLVHLLIDWSNWHAGMKELFNSYKPLSQAPNNNIVMLQNVYIKEFGSELRDRIIQINYEAERDDMNGYKLLKPQNDWITDLSKVFTLHIWTSNDKRTIIPLLQKLNIDQFFKTVVTRNDVYYIKPEKDGFEKINTEHKSPECFMMIGDSASDRGAAKSAGIDFLHVESFKS